MKEIQCSTALLSELESYKTAVFEKEMWKLPLDFYTDSIKGLFKTVILQLHIFFYSHSYIWHATQNVLCTEGIWRNIFPFSNPERKKNSQPLNQEKKYWVCICRLSDVFYSKYILYYLFLYQWTVLISFTKVCKCALEESFRKCLSDFFIWSCRQFFIYCNVTLIKKCFIFLYFA